jgi:hypothetical protein
MHPSPFRTQPALFGLDLDHDPAHVGGPNPG